MKKSNFYILLTTFSKTEIKELKKWLQSPIHNLRDDVCLLLECLTDGNEIKGENEVEKSSIFSQVFPTEPYNDAKMRQTIFFLMKATENYLIFKKSEQNSLRSKIILAEEYRERKLDKAFLRTIAEADDMMALEKYQDENFWLYSYYLEREKLRFQEKQPQREAPNQKATDYLDISYISAKLRQACLIMSWSSVSKYEYHLDLMEELISFVQAKELLNIPAIAIYYHIYHTLKDKTNEQHFLELRNCISKYGKLFKPSERKEIYLAAINYCIGRMNLGEKQSYLRISFELYKGGFEQEVFIENNILSKWTFRNAINIAFQLKEFDWAEKCIENYQSYIGHENRNDFVLFNIAVLHFEKKNYGKAMKMFSQVEYSDVFTSLSARSYIIRMLYEQDEWDVLDAQLDSVQNYLRRKEILGYHKTPFKNFVRFVRKLMKAPSMSNVEKNALRDEMSQSPNLPAKEWLIKQLEFA